MNRALFTLFFIVLVWSGVLGQSLKINEFCAINSILFDEDSDSPDWFELYNLGSEDINLLNYSITDDSTNYKKWIFPSLNLKPNEVLLVYASGKDRKELIYYKNLINHGDTFSYSIGSSNISIEWKSLGFVDDSWVKGPSGFGYGDNDDSTLVDAETLSVFVRKSFQIDDLNSIKELILHVDYDDGFVAYLNGSEIARANLGTPNTDVAYNQTADNYTEPLMINGQTPAKFNIANYKNLLIEGENVLALQVHNHSTGSSDLTLIPFLSVGYDSPVSGNPMPKVLRMNDKILHANFKISSRGEKLFLSNENNVIIDQTDSITLPPNISYGRVDDGENNWFYFSESTPGSLNTTQGYDSITNQSVFFSPIGGKYSTSIDVSLSTVSGSEIYYTIDGSDPSINSTKYETPINLSQTIVIRAITISSNMLSVSPSVETYIIENRDFTLPILSLSTDPYNLWDWNYGILVMGPNAKSDHPYFNANFWMDWERPINIEYFNKHGEKLYSSAAGTKIFGAWSRANEQKSMAFFARSSYGNNSFDYPFFKESNINSYKSFVIRNSGNDWSESGFRDAMMTGLMSDVDIERQAYQPVTVFLNGDYWGMLNMREKVNEDFLANHHPIDPDKVDILEFNGDVVEGSAEHYNNMINFIKSNGLESSSNYDSVCKLMDVINFMEYEIAQIYFDNRDWPGNNVKFWRPQTDNGKWRWILYDTDFGFGIWDISHYSNNTLAFAMETDGPEWPNPPWSTYLFRALLKNETFKKEFSNRFADRLNYNFTSDKVNFLIDSLSSNIKDEIPYHIGKWNHMGDFEGQVQRMKRFASNRQFYVRDHINSRFKLGGVVNLTVDISDIQAGSVIVNSLNNLNKYPWEGKYFNDNEIIVKAVANPGYEFSHWEGIDSTNPELHIFIPTSGIDLKAIFEVSTNDYNSIVVNEINYKSDDDNDSGDWIEFYNTTESEIDISQWIVKDSYDDNIFVFPSGTKIYKKSYLVVCKSQDKFQNIYPHVDNVVGDMDFGLGSISDFVRLYDKNNLIIDSVSYLAENPWPEINSDKTISLVNPYTDNNIGSHWEESVGIGTPGHDNEYFTGVKQKIKIVQKITATCFPNPTFGQATIRWSSNELQQVKIRIFDIDGRLVANLYDGLCSKGTFEEVWDTSGGYKAGIYFIQLRFENGLSKTLKLIKM